MAIRNYLITGLPGTGKSAVCKELALRGHRAIDADDFGFRGDPQTGKPTTDKNQLTWLWNEERLERILQDKTHDVAFICGSASNREKFLPRFNHVFTLRLDDKTLEHRLLTRTNNNFGKKPEILARQIAQNKGVVAYAQKNGMVLIDATKPISEVASEISGYVALH